MTNAVKLFTRYIWTVLAGTVVVLVLARVFWGAIVPSDSQPAKLVPPMTFARLDGSTLSTRGTHGQPYFIDFFASWCEPCRQELPDIMAWARAHPDTPVIPVDVGEPRNVAASYAKSMHLGNVALDPNAIARHRFNIIGFPTLVAVDATGRIRGRWDGLNPAIGSVMDETIASMLTPNGRP